VESASFEPSRALTRKADRPLVEQTFATLLHLRRSTGDSKKREKRTEEKRREEQSRTGKSGGDEQKKRIEKKKE
jgi:hypothetical protein